MSYKALKAKLLSRWQGKAEASKMKFAFRITDLLKRNSMSNKDLADKLYTSNAYVTKMLRGDQNFSIESMHKIADALDAEFCFHLSPKGSSVRWFDVYTNKKAPPQFAVKERVKLDVIDSPEVDLGYA